MSLLEEIVAVQYQQQQGEESSFSYAISLESVESARERIKNWVHQTPVLTSAHLDLISGGGENKDKSSSENFPRHRLHFKCEFLQKTGSFKARGASNAIIKNSYSSVCTHSSGNHGQALAWAAQRRGVPAHIVMPRDSPLCKVNAVRQYQGIVTFCEPNLAARELTAERVMQETGSSFVHPYDDPDVMSGQGTIALEFLEQVPDLDLIIVPIGGGGMCSGVATAAKALKPSIIIVAAEPEAANDAFRSKQSNQKLCNEGPPKTIADGLKTNLGENPWPIVRDKVDDVMTVSEEEIRGALRLVWERMKCLIEPSAAVGVAVALTPEFGLVRVLL